MLELKDLYALNVSQASSYFGIGVKKLRTLAYLHPELFFYNGVKLMVKRHDFEIFLRNSVSI